jgi:glycosyltransferase involved in cell wall biosynthesis
MKLSILIPTYNRKRYIEKNYKELHKTILDAGLSEQIQLVISNNCSNDGTFEFLNEITNVEVKSVIYQQDKNIGSVQNFLFLLEHATTEYILFLGDDDYLQPDYLSNVISLIEDRSISVIIPSNKGISEAGKDIGFSRDIGLDNTHSKAGFKSCLMHSWRGHQLSGLVFRRSNLSEITKQYKISNMYLFIFLVAYSTLQGDTYHLTKFPVSVTRPPQKDKEWSYGDDGLISEIFDNYRKLPGISYIQRSRLELKILDDQYWRYIMYIKLGLTDFIKAMLKISFGKNTSRLTSILFPMILPYILIKRTLLLLLKGDLYKTLTRPVDI